MLGNLYQTGWYLAWVCWVLLHMRSWKEGANLYKPQVVDKSFVVASVPIASIQLRKLWNLWILPLDPSTSLNSLWVESGCNCRYMFKSALLCTCLVSFFQGSFCHQPPLLVQYLDCGICSKRGALSGLSTLFSLYIVKGFHGCQQRMDFFFSCFWIKKIFTVWSLFFCIVECIAPAGKLKEVFMSWFGWLTSCPQVL